MQSAVSVPKAGEGRAMNNAQHSSLWSGKSSSNKIALWQLSERESPQTPVSNFFSGAFPVVQKFLQSNNLFYETGSEEARGGEGTI